jgi:DNA-binding HxlR family transcriptional regulator
MATTSPATGPTAPPALRYSADNCTVGRTMAILGERWTFVVIREVFNGIRRFDDMRHHTSIPRQVLTNRLGMLVDHGLLRKEPYQVPGERARHEYRLTQKGLDLYPVMVAIAQWGDRYLANPEGPPVEFTHRDCGAAVSLVAVCSDGHQVDDVRGIVPRPGPGARRARERQSR